MSVTYQVVRRLALALPEMEDGVSYGTPALKVGGKLVARLREDGETLALRIGFPEREELMHSDPEAFFITDHYLKYPAVVVRLSKVRRNLLQKLVTDTWRLVAPKKLVAAFETSGKTAIAARTGARKERPGGR